MTDQEFVSRFEDLKLEPDEFKHEAHLRYAFLCLQNANLEEAVMRVSTNISAYAAHLGVPDMFHFTITQALMSLIALRLKDKASDTWSAFLQDNPDLVSNAQAILLEHYSSERLFSDEARQAFLTPDLLAF